jgi:hypothetical protein
MTELLVTPRESTPVFDMWTCSGVVPPKQVEFISLTCDRLFRQP